MGLGMLPLLMEKVVIVQLTWVLLDWHLWYVNCKAAAAFAFYLQYCSFVTAESRKLTLSFSFPHRFSVEKRFHDGWIALPTSALVYPSCRAACQRSGSLLQPSSPALARSYTMSWRKLRMQQHQLPWQARHLGLELDATPNYKSSSKVANGLKYFSLISSADDFLTEHESQL